VLVWYEKTAVMECQVAISFADMFCRFITVYEHNRCMDDGIMILYTALLFNTIQ